MANSTKFYSRLNPDEIKSVERRKTLTTGVKRIDTLFGFPTGYYVICANPGTGKGFFATWISRQFWRFNQEKSVYFSLEMPESLVRERLLQQWSDLTQEQYMSGADTSTAISLLKDDVIVVDELSEDEQILEPIRLYKAIETYFALGYRIFHFDHLHELSGANDNNRNQAVTEEWAKIFQIICKDFPEIWLFIYAQPNGASASKYILRRTDIAGSKAITQKCEFFLSLNRKVELDENGEPLIDKEDRTVILYLDKSRVTSKSHTGFRLLFDETGNFTELDLEVM